MRVCTSVISKSVPHKKTMARPIALLLLLLLALSMQLLLAAQAQTSGYSDSTSTSSASNATVVTAESQCKLCCGASTCSLAYRNTPGVFCNNWLDTADQLQACCCANSDLCAQSTSTCQCREVSTISTTTGHSPSRCTSSSECWWSAAMLGSLSRVASRSAARSSTESESASQLVKMYAGVHQPVYSVQRVYGQPVYGQPGSRQPVYVQDGYVQQGYEPSYGDGGRRGMGSGMGSGAVAAGVGGSLLGDLILGNALDGGGGGFGGGFEGADF